MIIVRDLLQALGFIIDFNDHTMTWDKATIPMKEYGKISTLAAADAYCDEIFITDVEHEITARMTRKILDAKYKQADLQKVVSESKHLTENE